MYFQKCAIKIVVHKEMNSEKTFAVIPSNSLAESYPENKSSDFSVPLPLHLSFPTKEDWKVSLLEIQVPITFFNLDDSIRENYLSLREGSLRKVIKLSPGLYQTAEDLIEEINKHIKRTKLLNFKNLKLDDTSQKVYVQLKEDQKIGFSERLARILSLPRKIVFNPEGKSKQIFKSETQIDAWRDFHNLFIYSDLVQDRIVNENTAPLLQTVSVNNNEFGNLLIRSYFPPEYLKTRYEHYSTARFWITNEIGDRVRFRTGSVVLKLQFIKNDSLSGN